MAQWTIERTIGNLKLELRQPSNYLVNFACEGLRRARVNALLAALPDLDNSQAKLSNTVLNLGDRYVFLHKWDRLPICASHGTTAAILDFLGRPFGLIPKIRRWAHLRLPNGQITWSAWRETLRSLETLRVSCIIKVSLYLWI